jgi:hypothetical protein
MLHSLNVNHEYQVIQYFHLLVLLENGFVKGCLGELIRKHVLQVDKHEVVLYQIPTHHDQYHDENVQNDGY